MFDDTNVPEGTEEEVTPEVVEEPTTEETTEEGEAAA